MCSIPVNPQPELLPFNDPNFTWERFEAFSESFIAALPGVRDAHRYGGRGSTQRGIDIIAEMENGKRHAFQCKRYKQFDDTKAKKAIDETTYEADRYVLLLSCPASTGVREVIAEASNWDVWDVADISRKVRGLLDAAIPLVEHHFGPAWRQAFLGVDYETPWLDWQDFFEPFHDKTKLFNHAWALVGREDVLDAFKTFVASNTERVLILPGRGGVGKSKVLYAFAEQFEKAHPGYTLRFCEQDAPIPMESQASLPPGPCVIVADDAHRLEDLGILLAIARRRERAGHPTKLLFSIRPYGMDRIRSQLGRAGLDPAEVRELVSLQAPGKDDLRLLARQATDNAPGWAIERLVSAAGDNPLVVVVGGQLIADNAIPLDLLGHHAAFQRAVLDRFEDVLLGEVIRDSIGWKEANRVLQMVAATAPIRLDDREYVKAASDFVNMEMDELRQVLGVLEEFGVMIRHGRLLRITPDVLADHILHKACYTPQGDITGYAERVFGQFRGLCPQAVLGNLAELAWRQRRGEVRAETDSDLLGEIWASIEAEFKDAAMSEQVRLLEILEDVAYYLPRRMLRLVEIALEPLLRGDQVETNDKATSEEVSLEDFDLFEGTFLSQQSQLEKVAADSLRKIAYSVELVPRCVELLWAMTKGEGGLYLPYPREPAQVLEKLAKYEFEKPLSVQEALVSAVEGWVQDMTTYKPEVRFAPTDIATHLLSKQIGKEWAEGPAFTWTSGVLKLSDRICAMRKRVIDAVATYGKHGDIVAALRAVKTLAGVLTEPIHSSRKPINEEERTQFEEEQLQALAALEEIWSANSDPLVADELSGTVLRLAGNHETETVQKAARSLLERVEQTFEVCLTHVLRRSTDPWDPSIEYTTESSEAHQTQTVHLRREVVRAFLDRHPDPALGRAEMVLFLDHIQDTTRRASASELLGSGRPDPWLFLRELAQEDSNYAEALARLLIAGPEDILTSHLTTLLISLREHRPDIVDTLIAEGLANESSKVRAAVAGVYQGRRGEAPPEQEELDAIQMLVIHSDSAVRLQGIRAVQSLAWKHPEPAKELALAVEVRGEKRIAKELCGLFSEDGRFGIDISSLADDEVKAVIRKLETVDDLDAPETVKFLNYAAARQPEEAFQILLRRIESDDPAGKTQDPLPFVRSDNGLDGFSKTASYPKLLRVLCERAARFDEHRPSYARLFGLMVKRFDEQVWHVLETELQAHEPERVRSAAGLFYSVPPGFVFDHPERVEIVLLQAAAAEPEALEIAQDALRSSVENVSRSRVHGYPFPEDVRIRDRSREHAALFNDGSLPHRFYTALADAAESAISRELQSDDERFKF